VGDVHLLLFEGLAHLFRQLVEQLSYGAVVEVASLLRKNLAREDSDRLAMAGVSTPWVGVDDFAAGEHAG